MSAPKISVIVPVYNVERYLPECIGSILSQTFTDLELILVDDGSPDGSGRLCDEAARRDERVKAIHQANGGVSRARNSGIQAARGEYLCFVDGDDTMPREALADLYREVERHPGVDVVTGCILLAGNVIGPTDDTPDYTASRRYIRSRTLWELLNFSMYSRLVRRTLVVDNAIFLAEGVTCGEDPLWVYMLHKKIASAARCKKIVYTYRQNEESVMHQKDSTKNYCSQLWTAVLAARAFGPDGRWAETKYLQDLLSLGRRRRAYGNSDETKVAARLKEVYREITRTSVPWQVKWWAWRLQLPYRTATSRLVKLADRFVGLTLKAISR